MKNVIPYQDDTFTFYKDVISRKNNTQSDPKFKEKVNDFNPNIKKLFLVYNTKFDSNILGDLTAFGYLRIKKKRLLKLYSFKAKIFQELKVKLTTRKGNIQDAICQNCTLSEVNSFDHVVPKDEFPEFVVNPKNLFPSCTNCNSRKGTTWRENGKSVFLNLYTDVLPNKQYLFVDIQIENSELNLSYSLFNVNDEIDSELFNLIKTHYDKLGLCQRFKENSDVIVAELENEINKYKNQLPLDSIVETIQEECREEKNLLGFNYWKSILKLSLIHNDGYMSRFYT